MLFSFTPKEAYNNHFLTNFDYLVSQHRNLAEHYLVEGAGLYLSPLFHPEEDYDGLKMKNGEHTYDQTILRPRISLYGNF